MSHTLWASPDLMRQTWLPVHFAPRFLAVERYLDEHAGDYVRLADLVNVAPLRPVGDDQPAWHVFRQGDALAVLPPTTTDTEGLVALPDECVVVHPLVQEQIASAFWSSRLMGGGGATHSTAYALVGRGTEDIAWLDAALKEKTAGLQLERAGAGGLVPLVRAEDLLNLRIRKLPLAERQLLSRRIRQHRRSSRHVALPFDEGLVGSVDIVPRWAPTGSTQPVLTGATHEERVDQFERILFEEQVTSPGNAFFVHAASADVRNDAFLARPVGDDSSARAPVSGRSRSWTELFTNDAEAAAAWRDWYWNPTPGDSFRVFNNLDGGPILPSAITAALQETTVLPPEGTPARGLRIPSFRDFRTAIEANRDGHVDLEDARKYLGVLWDTLNPGNPLKPDTFAWLRHLYRPALVIRVRRDGQSAGAYLLLGPDQFEEPGTVAAYLETQGQRFSAMLEQPSQIAEDAARRESLNRLSWMMHQLAGPLSRIGNVLQELTEFVARRPDVGAELMPDEPRAVRRAEMNGVDLEGYRLEHRLEQLSQSVEDIRRLQYQIRQYKNAQGQPHLTDFLIVELLRDLGEAARGQRPELLVKIAAGDDVFVQADRALVTAALSEVINNSCREYSFRAIKEPYLLISAEQRGKRVQIAVEDNAMPTDEQLITDPFAMDASTYSARGKGSGLGLAIVKETFARHGGRCQLQVNRSADGLRQAGVSFVTDVALSTDPKEVPSV